MNRKNTKYQNRENAPKPLSNEEVARFLKHLAAGYRDKRTGNPALAEAIMRVVTEILDYRFEGKSLQRAPVAKQDDPELDLSVVSSLSNLSEGEVNQFISDSSKTKAQLIDLAAARFGIPRSKLLKLTVDHVRDAVRSALMHEASLAVIAEEAARYGLRRQS